jgi:hypothetical protein
MSQVLHIFRKDSRRFWPEIVVSLVLVAGLAWTSPYTWPWDRPPAEVALTRIANYMPLLVMAAWWLLIVRVIHAESLVGDRQFWITRPYEWKKLLAAKVLFLGIYIYLPLAVAQCAMLALAGFHPAWHIAGLLYDLLLITGTLVLPWVALACVTSNLARMALTVAGIIACYVGLILTMSFGIFGTSNSPSVPGTNLIGLAIALCLCGAAIGLQYATRRAWLARTVLLSLPLVMYASVDFAPIFSVDHVYAQKAGAAGALPQLAYDLQENVKQGAVTQFTRSIGFGVPIKALGAPEGTVLVLDNAKIEIETADGSKWVSPWEGLFGMTLDQHAEVNLSLPKTVYERFRDKPLSLHLTLAVSQGRVQSSSNIPFPSTEASIAGDGICMATGEWTEKATFDHQDVHTQCRYPLRNPYLTHIVLRYPDPACSPSGGAMRTDLGWSRNGSPSEPAQLAIDPVFPGSNMGSGESVPARHSGISHPCPGTVMTFTEYRVVGRTQASLTVPDYHLPPLSEQ